MQFLVPDFGGHVDGAGSQVQGANGVTTQHTCVSDRNVVLEVGLPELDLAEEPAAPPVNEDPRLVNVPPLAGVAAQLHQGRLDFRMPLDFLQAAGPEDLADVVGGTDGDLDEGVIAAGACPGDTGLDEVAETVQLMAPLEIRVPRLLTRPTEHGVQVPVIFLNRCNA